MASLLTLNSNPNVYYKAPQNTTLNKKSSVAEQTTTIPENNSNDSFSSNKAGINTESDIEEKDSIGKKFVRFIGGVVIVAAALFTAYKWKGDKWLNPEAQGFGAKIKNWLMKPGEYMEKGFNKLRGKGKAKSEGETNPKPESETNPKPEGETNPKPEGETTTNNVIDAIEQHQATVKKLENRIKLSSNLTKISPDGDPIPIIEFNSPQKVDVINDEEIAKFVERCRAEGIDFKPGVSVGLCRVEPNDTKLVKGQDANYVMTTNGHCEDGILLIVRCLYKAKSVSENIEKELNSITERYIIDIK